MQADSSQWPAASRQPDRQPCHKSAVLGGARVCALASVWNRAAFWYNSRIHTRFLSSTCKGHTPKKL